MEDAIMLNKPEIYNILEQRCREIGFTMPSDLHIGSLLKTLVASKPAGNFLELGTGIGLSLSWMVDGMDAKAKLITLDNDLELIKIAREYFGSDQRIDIICTDGTEWIKKYDDKKFDLIFADAWPGKYSELDETLALLEVGGLYVIDDMSIQPNWPEGHQENVDGLIHDLEQRTDLSITKLNWSTGVIMATKLKT
ncbi:MAG: O-methyltransferase [Flavobacteriaceae bacterium]